MRSLLLMLPLLAPQSAPLPGPSQAQGSAGPLGSATRPNVLLIVADDLGVEHVEFHPVGRATGNTAHMPHLGKLSAEALVYTDFYATPICSATRASLLTGRYSFRHGLSRKLVPGEPGLPSEEVTIAEQLLGAGYRTGAFGKWHISYDRNDPGKQGFELYDGSLLNLSGGAGAGYYQWMRIRNGKLSQSTRYATTVTTDAAASWIRDRNGEPGPWFAYVAYHAPHKPYETPPPYLNPKTNAQDADSDLVIFHGMAEAMDREIARLMREVDLRDTLVIFVGDNGSAPKVAQGPVQPNKAKQTAYEGGIRVPAMILGAGVFQSPGEYGGLVHVVDLFNTILDYTGTPRLSPKVATIDSVSLFDPALAADMRWLPNRQTLFTERFGPNGKLPFQSYKFLWRSLRGHRYKLLRTLGGDRLFDLQQDPWELTNLAQGGLSPAHLKEYKLLKAELEELVNSADQAFEY